MMGFCVCSELQYIYATLELYYLITVCHFTDEFLKALHLFHVAELDAKTKQKTNHEIFLRWPELCYKYSLIHWICSSDLF